MHKNDSDACRNIHYMLGLPFDAVTLDQAVARIRYAVQTRTPCFLSTPNLNFLIAAQSNEAFRQSVIHSDLSLADGMPIVWLAKLMGIPIPERVAGSDVFEVLRRASGSSKIKIYFFGGTPGVAQLAAEKINSEDGGLVCVGWDSPGFGDVKEMSGELTLERINRSEADFLIVSLGAVKGQAWIEFNRSRINAPVVSHLGAVVNFVAGNVQRAPVWMQKSGFEWLWRIREEPGLWRRYFSDGIELCKLTPSVLTAVFNRLLKISKKSN
jgi:N-acetylglucosaminyldiphosphoundecaprenol N-acetyl-beta-D-mannosaminyltransferase